ncbi:MAG TPA: cupin domain-containing protein [Sphingomonas sp.]|nr:cupin domain-containing protein [Sphingomonas sp.]
MAVGRTKMVSVVAIGMALVAPQLNAQSSPAAIGAASSPERPVPQVGWSPKRTPYRSYDAPNRPWWKLADVLALHKGTKTWIQPVVRNRDLMADWHQMAAGTGTPEVEYPDNRTAIIVWSGQLRVSIKGQEPFIATKGFEIDIPFRLPFRLEAIGDAPALWLEVHASGDLPIYPVTTNPDKPKDQPGFTYQKTILSGGDGKYEGGNKPYLDFYKDVVEGGARAGAFISGDHMFVNNIRGKGTVTPPASNLGHFHFGYDEFWFVMEGNVDYQIEGVPFFTASAGDIVTAAQGRWHRASFGGIVGQMDTRVAINPYPSGLHNYSLESGGRQ